MMGETTRDFRDADGIGTMCGRYGLDRKPVDIIKCEHEKTDRYHMDVCKYFDCNSGMCRYYPPLFKAVKG